MSNTTVQDGLSFRSARQRLLELNSINISTFLRMLQDGELRTYIFVDETYKCYIPTYYWDKINTIDIQTTQRRPRLYKSIVDLRDCVSHEMDELTRQLSEDCQIDFRKFHFFRNWIESLSKNVAASDVLGNVSILASLAHSILKYDDKPWEVFVSRESIASIKPLSKNISARGRKAVRGPDAMWIDLINFIIKTDNLTKKDIEKRMREIVQDRGLHFKSKTGDDIFNDNYFDRVSKDTLSAVNEAKANSRLAKK